MGNSPFPLADRLKSDAQTLTKLALGNSFTLSEGCYLFPNLLYVHISFSYLVFGTVTILYFIVSNKSITRQWSFGDKYSTINMFFQKSSSNIA